MNEEDHLRMPREAFDRLPLDVQVATLEKMRHNRAFIDQCLDIHRKRAPHGALFGALAAFVLTPTIAFHPILMVLMAVGGAVAGFFIVIRQINHLFSIALFGALAMAGSIFAYTLNWLNVGQTLFMFFGWIFFCTAGALISFWACKAPTVIPVKKTP